MTLAEQMCISSKGGSPLTEEEVRELAKETPDWAIKGGLIERTFAFPNFVEAMKFANRITKVAEEQDHHPDLHISWGKVRVELSTHSVGGLSRNDFIMAAKIDRVRERTEGSPSI